MFIHYVSYSFKSLVLVCFSLKQNISFAGVYTRNVTLYYRNSPYLVQNDLTIERNAMLTIESGVHVYFDNGVGIKVKGAIWAMVSIITLIITVNRSNNNKFVGRKALNISLFYVKIT